MFRQIALIVAAFALQIASASALTLNGVTLDPHGLVRPAILEQAIARWRDQPEARRDVIAIADFGRPSTEPRFAIIDLSTGAVVAMRTAHGKGSDRGHDGIAETFSDEPGSNATPLGLYRTGARYQGQHGLSLKLEGLDASNRNAAARAIVVHSAPYMAQAFITAHGRPGRSWGCIVVDPDLIAGVVDRLENGALVYAGR